MSADTTAQAINAALDTKDFLWAVKMLVQGRDHLRLLLRVDPRAVGSWTRRVVEVEDARFDLLLRALVQHEFAELDCAAPAWAATEPLDEPWLLRNPFLTADQTCDQTPEWLRRLNIFIAERDLSTA